MPIMKKVIFKAGIFLLVLCLLSCVVLTGCGKGPAIEEIKDRAVWLIEHSYSANTILFGEGLPVFERNSPVADLLYVYDSADTTPNANYNLVSAATLFRTQAEMMEYLESVYSSAYLASLYPALFTGTVYEFGDGSASVEGARYREEAEGILYQSSQYSPFVTGERIYDYSTMTIVGKSTPKQVKIRLDSYKLGETEEKLPITLTFVFERNAWYLDSPTY